MDFKYRPDIDGLRTLAVMLVLVFHFKLLPLGKGGFMGVDIFFVISGYLITSILFKQLNSDSFSFKTFYFRRIKRLAPSLVTVLLLTLIYGYFTLLPSDFIGLANQLVASQFYFSNIYFWQNLNYFGLRSDSTILLHTWSLAVEEQFYIIYPAVLLILFKYFKTYVWHAIGLGILFSFLLNIYFVETKPELTFYLLPTRAWELLIGAGLVFITPKLKPISKVINNILGVLGLVLIISGVLFYSAETIFPGWHALYPVLGAALLILSGNNANSITAKFFSTKILVYIGQLSYALYLVHWPINVFAKDVFEDSYTTDIRFMMLLLTFVISAIIYHLIEQPLRENRFTVKPKTIIYHYMSTLLVSILVIVFINKYDGLPSRFSKESQYYASFMNDGPPSQYSSCAYDPLLHSLRTNDFCVLGNKEQPPKWIILGDSHANALSPALDIFLENNNESGLFLYRYACPPLQGISVFKAKGECKSYNQAVLEFLKTHKHKIDNILLVSTWTYPFEQILTTDHTKQLALNESKTLYKKSFAETITVYKDLDMNIFIWEPVPIAKANVPKALAKSKANELNTVIRSISTDLISHHNKFDYFYLSISENSETISGVFSAANALCNSEYCKLLIGDIPIYQDNAHISYSSRNFWSVVLAEQHNNFRLNKN